jgi:hypothetical protein
MQFDNGLFLLGYIIGCVMTLGQIPVPTKSLTFVRDNNKDNLAQAMYAVYVDSRWLCFINAKDHIDILSKAQPLIKTFGEDRDVIWK